MNHNFFTPRMKGIVRLVIRDAKTEEILREQEQENLITGPGFSHVVSNIFQIQGGVGLNDWILWISNRQCVDNPNRYSMRFYTGSPQPGYGVISPAGPPVRVVAGTLTTPWYVEYLQRFNPSATTRTIWSVGITDATSAPSISTGTRTAVALITPCTQTNTEILDVYYRIQIIDENFGNPLDPLSYPVAGSTSRAWAEWIAGTNFSGGGTTLYGTAPSNAKPNGLLMYTWEGALPAANTLGSYVAQDIGGSFGSIVFFSASVDGTSYYNNNYYWGAGARLEKSISTNGVGCGMIMGTAVYGNQLIGNAITGQYAAPIVPSTWQPAQNIHKHNANATQPFLDASFLSSGTGTMNNTAASWTNPDWPKYYRIQINATGAVGASTYSFYVRNISGFRGSTPIGASSYAGAPMNSLMLMTSTIAGTNRFGVSTGGNFMNTAHGLGADRMAYNIEKYDGKSTVHWTSVTGNGVSLVNYQAPSIKSFNASSTPALPVTGIRQVCVDDLGNIWVACSNTGLWKIANPTAPVPTITNYTSFTNASPPPTSLTTTNAYAVDCGYNNNVFALVNGGIVRTSDGGTTWTIYDTTSTPAFSFTGITNSLWNNVYFMRLQKNSTTFRMAFMRSADSGVTGNIVWWSLEGTAAAAGPTGLFVSPTFSSGYLSASVTAGIATASSNFRVSKTGEMWVYGNASPAQYFRIQWGASTGTSMGYLAGAQPTNGTPGISFAYDFYGTPYVVANSPGSSTIPLSLLDIASVAGTQTPWVPTSFGTGITVNNMNFGFDNGMFICNSTTGTPTRPNLGFYLASLYADFTTTVGNKAYQASSRAPLNLQHTALQEVVWTQYGWNGASWQAGYWAPEPDTAGAVGGPFDGARYNYDPESRSFTGRSCIKVPTTVLTTYFTTALTVAMRVTPLAKLSTTPTATGNTNTAGQRNRQQLFTITNTTTGARYRLYLYGGASDTQITLLTQASQNGAVNTYTFGTTPVLVGAGSMNVVVILTGTSASVYVNGTQVGVTTTIAPSVSISSASTILVLGGNTVDLGGFQNAEEFYRGTMENILIDSSAWTGTDITNHNTNPLTYAGTATTQVRYQMTSSLAGLESKPTHVASQALNDGVEVRFTDGSPSATSFVATDYYTFGVCKGILQDNATTFTQQYNFYMGPVTNGFSTITPSVITNSTVSRQLPYATRITGGSLSGQYFRRQPSATTNVTMYSAQSTTGNLVFSWYTDSVAESDPTSTELYNVGLGEATSQTFGFNVRFEARFSSGGTVPGPGNVSMYLSNALAPAGSNVTTWTYGDQFEFRRVGTTITFWKNGGLIYTYAATSNVRLWFFTRTFAGYPIPGTMDTTFDCDPLFGIIGDPTGYPATGTGVYDPNFWTFDATNASNWTVNIAGYVNPAAVTLNTNAATPMDALATPGANQVIVMPDVGLVKFNVADAGKLVTISVPLVKRTT